MNHYACAILLRDGKILLGKRAAHRRAYPNCWDVIGGKVGDGEAVDIALSRELSEELGITPVDYVSIGSVEDNNPHARGLSTYHLFVVRGWTGGDPTARDDEPVSLPPDKSYRALNPMAQCLFSRTATCRSLSESAHSAGP
jgi:8-oxo-dGTP diphosphatase